MPLEVRPLSVADHLAFVQTQSGSFLQTPSWAGVKAEWGCERLGWYDGGRLVGMLTTTDVCRLFSVYLRTLSARALRLGRSSPSGTT